MDHWNAQFTQLIRKTHPTWWGNWSLGHEIRPGGIGVVDPLTGSFTPVADAIPGLTRTRSRPRRGPRTGT